MSRWTRFWRANRSGVHPGNTFLSFLASSLWDKPILSGYPFVEGKCSWTLPWTDSLQRNSFIGELVILDILVGISLFGEGRQVGIRLFPMVNLCTWFGNQFVCLYIDAGIWAVFVGNCLYLLCFGVIKLIIGTISSILKERSLGWILDMLRSEEQWPLKGSRLNNLEVRSTFQRRGTLWKWSGLGLPWTWGVQF